MEERNNYVKRTQRDYSMSFKLNVVKEILNTRKILVKQTVKVYNELRPHLSNYYLTPMQMHQQQDLIPKSYKKKNSTNTNICTV